MSLKEYLKDRIKLLRKDLLMTVALIGIIIFFLGLALGLHISAIIAGCLTYLAALIIMLFRMDYREWKRKKLKN